MYIGKKIVGVFVFVFFRLPRAAWPRGGEMEKKKIEEFFGQIADRTTSTSSTLLRVKEEELAREADAAWQAAAVLSDLAEALEEESERGLEKGHEKQEKEEKEKSGG